MEKNLSNWTKLSNGYYIILSYTVYEQKSVSK